MLEWKAKKLAAELHYGQYRKDGATPYITHPEEVVNILRKVGVFDDDVLSAAWLHDTVEDCGITKEFLREELNFNIARIVDQLTKNVSREEYKKRVLNADYPVQLIKLADVVHNCSNLTSELLPEKTVRNKLEDCNSLYLHLAEEVCPELHAMLQNYLKPFTNKE
ncbi:HD domain-containing protein [Candidatus Woesearchaeota archaeon]|nr:HD domain-containing protein [Candidatus Woesearchaeota archaeon]